jgi:hypothetical protein
LIERHSRRLMWTEARSGAGCRAKGRKWERVEFSEGGVETIRAATERVLRVC